MQRYKVKASWTYPSAAGPSSQPIDVPTVKVVDRGPPSGTGCAQSASRSKLISELLAKSQLVILCFDFRGFKQAPDLRPSLMVGRKLITSLLFLLDYVEVRIVPGKLLERD